MHHDGHENPAYLNEQLITYIGNKRRLLGFIESALDRVQERLGTERLSIADLFSGSGVVSRLFKRHATKLIANDLEPYAEIANRCYLANRSDVDLDHLRRVHSELTSRLEAEPLRRGIIATHYAPENDAAILPHDRVFYTSRNARYLDTARQLMDDVPKEIRHYLLAPLLSEASVHANTSGVFKGFYKDSATGIGTFGGSHRDALPRILGEIRLPFPVFSRFECDVEVYRRDANELVHDLPPIDLAYLDPPYNQHPYGSNYFMLNLLVDYREPRRMSRVSGIPADWRRSQYNGRRTALNAFTELVNHLRARFLLVSFNSEGFIGREAMVGVLSSLGTVTVLETKYNTFRGSRNLRNRAPHVTEHLYLVDTSVRR